MAKVLTAEDRVSNKTERFKAKKSQWDAIMIFPFALKDGMDPAAFYGVRGCAGKRAVDGSDWYVNLNDEDPTQNVAVEMGGRIRENVVVLVLHLGSYDEYGNNPRPVVRWMPWSFAGGWFEQMKMLVGGNIAALCQPMEILVRCAPGNKEEKFQDLMIQLAHPEKRLWPAIQKHAPSMARVTGGWVEAVDEIRDFIRPHTRQEQADMIRGRQDGQPPQAGFTPPQGMDVTGLPQGNRAQFLPPSTPAQGPPPGFAPPGAGPAVAGPFQPAPRPDLPFGPPANQPPVVQSPFPPPAAAPPGPFGPQAGGPFGPPPTPGEKVVQGQPVEDPNEILTAMLKKRQLAPPPPVDQGTQAATPAVEKDESVPF